MALLLKMFYQGYSRFVEENREPLIDDYFLMGSPLKIFAVTAIYWYFVMKIGQKWMVNRPPFDLKYTMLAFNALQVVFNGYLVFLAVRLVLTSSFYSDWSCMRRTEPVATFDELHGYYCYFLLKVSDYMDTIFMVLRKRNRQITFLHVYHHIIMVFGVYYVCRFAGGGHTIMLGLINGIVHMVMYSYYFLSALRPGIRNSVGWKKYITQLQLSQFVYLVFHFGRAVLNPNCNQSKALMFFCFLNAILMIFLFSDFYYKAYCKPMIQERKEKANKIK